MDVLKRAWCAVVTVLLHLCLTSEAFKGDARVARKLMLLNQTNSSGASYSTFLPFKLSDSAWPQAPSIVYPESVLSVAVSKFLLASFIGHGFLDFWPIFKSWEWTRALAAYVCVSITGIYVYSTWPGITMMIFMLSSAYHFGSDWEQASEAMFLGSTMIGLASYASQDIYSKLGIPNDSLFSIVYCSVGFVSLLTAWPRKKISLLFLAMGMVGFYGVTFYGVFVHAPRSVWLLAQKYGRTSIYLGWAFFTALVYAGLHVSDDIPFEYTTGAVLGVLFAHMILTACIREKGGEVLSKAAKKIDSPLGNV